MIQITEGYLIQTLENFLGNKVFHWHAMWVANLSSAILHRSGWQEISRMRHYMKYVGVLQFVTVCNPILRAVGSGQHLDEMLKQTMDHPPENYSSFEAFQQLINDVYESDQRESMIDLFQR